MVAQILNLDPRNDYAIGVRPFIEDQANFQEQRRWREEGQQAMTGIMNDAAEKMIPYNEIIRFPENWPDLSATRDRTVAMERGEGQQDAVVQAQLDKRLPELRFDAVGLTDVIDFLRDVSGANIFVNWRALEGATIDRNAPVTARLRDVPFRKALDIILQDVGGGTVKLAYTVDEGVITISTAEDLSGNTLTRVYDIRDLILQVPDFTDAPNFSLQSTSTTGACVPASPRSPIGSRVRKPGCSSTLGTACRYGVATTSCQSMPSSSKRPMPTCRRWRSMTCCG